MKANKGNNTNKKEDNKGKEGYTKHGIKHFTELNEKHYKFCEEVVKFGVSQRQAAINAGYSANNAGTNSTKMMEQPLIKEEIKRLREEYKEKVNVKKEHIIEFLKNVLKANIFDIFQKSNDFSKLIKNRDSIPEEIQQVVQEISLNKDGSFKVKLYSKMDAINTICKMLGYDDGNPIVKDAIAEAENEMEGLITGINYRKVISKDQYIKEKEGGNN